VTVQTAFPRPALAGPALPPATSAGAVLVQVVWPLTPSAGAMAARQVHLVLVRTDPQPLGRRLAPRQNAPKDYSPTPNSSKSCPEPLCRPPKTSMSGRNSPCSFPLIRPTDVRNRRETERICLSQEVVGNSGMATFTNNEKSADYVEKTGLQDKEKPLYCPVILSYQSRIHCTEPAHLLNNRSRGGGEGCFPHSTHGEQSHSRSRSVSGSGKIDTLCATRIASESPVSGYHLFSSLLVVAAAWIV
jgi:hypothetical protein